MSQQTLSAWSDLRRQINGEESSWRDPTFEDIVVGGYSYEDQVPAEQVYGPAQQDALLDETIELSAVPEEEEEEELQLPAAADSREHWYRFGELFSVALGLVAVAALVLGVLWWGS